MKILYIDYTSSVPIVSNNSAKSYKAHGGANYTRTVIQQIINYIDRNHLNYNIVILYPEGYQENTTVEDKIFSSKYIKKEIVSTPLDEFDFESNARIFFPLLSVKKYSLLKKLHNKGFHIILTLHGLRVLDMRYDKYDRFYFTETSDILKHYLSNALLPLKKTAYRKSIKKYLKYVDTLVTDSNFTLSRIAKITNISNVFLQYIDTLPSATDIKYKKQIREKSFMLFVSGNRQEKNLARTLCAYNKYYQELGEKALPFFIVGINKKTRSALIKNTNIEKFVTNKLIVFFDYVTDEQLAALYEQAAFLVYTSKSEGFGLPALEGAKHGCPTMASYGTSIPEVLGELCEYVNPYSIDSISDGMKKMTGRHDIMRSRLNKAMNYINQRIDSSNTCLVETLLGIY